MALMGAVYFFSQKNKTENLDGHPDENDGDPTYDDEEFSEAQTTPTNISLEYEALSIPMLCQVQVITTNSDGTQTIFGTLMKITKVEKGLSPEFNVIYTKYDEVNGAIVPNSKKDIKLVQVVNMAAGALTYYPKVVISYKRD